MATGDDCLVRSASDDRVKGARPLTNQTAADVYVEIVFFRKETN